MRHTLHLKWQARSAVVNLLRLAVTLPMQATWNKQTAVWWKHVAHARICVCVSCKAAGNWVCRVQSFHSSRCRRQWLSTQRPHVPWITVIRGPQPLLHLFNQFISAVAPDNTFASAVGAISSHSFTPAWASPPPVEKFLQAVPNLLLISCRRNRV